jgi:hypothetical protein
MNTIACLLILILSLLSCQKQNYFISAKGNFKLERRDGEYVSDHFLFDYNQDGYKDLLMVTLQYPPTLTKGNGRLLGVKNIDGEKLALDGDWQFSAIHPRWVAPIDWNRDGYQDLIVADHGPDLAPHPGAQNFVLLSNKDEVKKIDLFSKGFSFSVTTGRLSSEYQNVYFVANINDFQRSGFYSIDDKPESLGLRGLNKEMIESNLFMSAKLYDFNGDGWDDLFLGAMNGRGVERDRIYFNDGKGQFSTWIDLPKRFRLPSWGTVDIKIKKRGDKKFFLFCAVHNNAIDRGAVQVISLRYKNKQWQSSTVDILKPKVQGAFWIPWVSFSSGVDTFDLSFSVRRGVGEAFLGQRFGLYHWNGDHFEDRGKVLEKLLPPYYWSRVMFQDMNNNGSQELVFISMQQDYYYLSKKMKERL